MFSRPTIKGRQAGKAVFSGLLLFLGYSATVLAKGASGPAPKDALENPLAITLLIIISALALILALLAWVVNGAAGIFGKLKKSGPGATGAMITFILLTGQSLFAQDAATAVTASDSLGGMDTITFYVMLGIIFIELVGILYLLYNLRLLIRQEKEKALTAEESARSAVPKESLWSKLNKFKPVEQEADIDLGHDYDGIRELDNRLPPWWLYGFYLTIIVGVIYLWRFHVSHTGPSSAEEYQIAMTKAAEQQEEYLKKSANKVDENTVVMLDASGIAAGKSTFVTNCAACHGKLGEGGVGPNLTDDYWLHGGKINDVFKTIKYGYPEKGMRSWKDDLSPVMIAQVASYIKSIHGTNPPNAKAQQGELYTEGAAAPAKDSTGAGQPAAKDSTATQQPAK